MAGITDISARLLTKGHSSPVTEAANSEAKNDLFSNIV